LFTRPVQYWKDTVFAFNESGLFGHGTGTESLGLPYLYHIDLYEDFDTGLYRVEGGYASVLWEWGVVGLILWLLWTSAVVWGLARQSRLLKGTGWYAMVVCTTIYALFLLFPWFYMGLNFYQQYVAQAYLWFMIGVVYRLPSLRAVTEDEAVVVSPAMNYRMIAPCEARGNPWTR
jgi:O-antigen ligase